MPFGAGDSLQLSPKRRRPLTLGRDQHILERSFGNDSTRSDTSNPKEPSLRRRAQNATTKPLSTTHSPEVSGWQRNLQTAGSSECRIRT